MKKTRKRTKYPILIDNVVYCRTVDKECIHRETYYPNDLCVMKSFEFKIKPYQNEAPDWCPLKLYAYFPPKENDE